MSGITFTVTGSSNDTNLVLSSENAAIHEGGHHDEDHDHLLRSDISGIRTDISGLKTNVTSITSRVVNIEAKNTMQDVSLVALLTADLSFINTVTYAATQSLDTVQTGRLNVVDVSITSLTGRVVTIEAKNTMQDASLVALLAADLSFINTVTYAATQSLDTVQTGRLNVVDVSITSLTGRVGNIEAKNTMQDASLVALLTADLSFINTVTYAATQSLDTVQTGRLDVLDVSFTSITGRVVNIEAKNTAQDASLVALLTADLSFINTVTYAATQSLDTVQTGRLNVLDASASTLLSNLRQLFLDNSGIFVNGPDAKAFFGI